MKPIASLTKKQENDMKNTGEDNTEPVAQTYKSSMIPYVQIAPDKISVCSTVYTSASILQISAATAV